MVFEIVNSFVCCGAFVGSWCRFRVFALGDPLSCDEFSGCRVRLVMIFLDDLQASLAQCGRAGVFVFYDRCRGL